MITRIDLCISYLMTLYQTHVHLGRYQVLDGKKTIYKTCPLRHTDGLILESAFHNWLNSSQDTIRLTILK